MTTPAVGQVLGIDVGFSARRRTTCFCLLKWTAATADFSFEVANADSGLRQEAIASLGLSGSVHAVAVDGPLTNGLRLVSHYRAAEAVLSRGVLQKRGKPGQTSSPVGQQLHRHATVLTHLALQSADVVPATHQDSIHGMAVVEAFPNMYLAALVPEVDLPVLTRDASDRYWEILVTRSDRLMSLLQSLLPGRDFAVDLGATHDHEQRAGVVCALTALSMLSGRYVAIGDPTDGDIILPAQSEWGQAIDGQGTWLHPVLEENLKSVRAGRRGHANHCRARIVTMSGEPNNAPHLTPVSFS